MNEKPKVYIFPNQFSTDFETGRKGAGLDVTFWFKIVCLPEVCVWNFNSSLKFSSEKKCSVILTVSSFL